MKPSVLVLSLVLFVAAIVVFSNGYGTLMRFFAAPTLELLVRFGLWFALELVLLTAMGFIMYATDRKAGNVKVKNAFFDRLLGIDPQAEHKNAD
jgi:hypothetical protein